MRPVDERTLRARLQRVEALHDGATTPGEREAAHRARHRLLERLAEVRANDPVARFCAEHVAALAVAPEPPPPPERLPDARTLLGLLARWEAGELDGWRLCAWAERVVDRVDLPDDPLEPGATVAEVLLQLSALRHVDLQPGDVPRIRRFLRDGDWNAWFALVADAAARTRRKRAS
ncbi:MAG: hypothetical protein R3F59_01160 [Myxococcota bacterium]